MLIRVGVIFKGYREIFILLYCLQWLHLLFQPKNGNKFLLLGSKLRKLASSGPYGPLLARSGSLGQDESFFNNPMVTKI